MFSSMCLSNSRVFVWIRNGHSRCSGHYLSKR